ncbi:MAG: endolytic transglycosylase MltG [Spirochaetaceae bacterium]|nr:MAG: endolytic transglycosylase MltG [Spirochaetaceae bacterium]
MGAVEHDQETPTARRSPAVRILLWLTVVCLAAAIAAVAGAWYLNSPPAGVMRAGGGERPFSVNRGESVISIAQRLEQAGLIRSARFLALLSVAQQTQNRFQSGNYLLDPAMTAIQLHDYLISGRQQLVRVTIPEGWTIRRIAAHLEDSGIVAAAEFEAAARSRRLLQRFDIEADSAQGFLYPDTYYFHQDYPAEAVVAHMIETFLRVAREIYPEFEQLSAAEIYDHVILASIIEREYIAPDEAPLMASVFYNRLNAGMRLESCATVVYVMTEEHNLPHPNRLFYRDLERESPFNTYRNPGLPPGPISNPGRNALQGAFYPADTDYWFFVLRGEHAERHHFSRNLQEHNQATVLYLRGPR